MRAHEFITEADPGRRGFLKNLAAGVGIAGSGLAGLKLNNPPQQRTVTGKVDLNPQSVPTAKQQQAPQSSKQSQTASDTKHNSEFINKLRKVSAELGVSASDLLKVMYFETRGTLNPAILSPHTRAVGLVQFMPHTAKGLGTSTEELIRMTAVEQLDWVLKYYKKLRLPSGSSVGEIYLGTLFPAALRLKLPDDHIMAINPRTGDPNLKKLVNKRIVDVSDITRGAMWRDNQAFKQPGRDYYTVGDIKNTVARRTAGVSL